MSKQKRIMPSERAIRTYWLRTDLPKDKGFDAIEFMGESCFACGMDSKCERAHILARCIGGADSVENLHMLCRICHKDSEGLSGNDYHNWLLERNAMDMLASVAARSGINLWTQLMRQEKFQRRMPNEY